MATNAQQTQQALSGQPYRGGISAQYSTPAQWAAALLQYMGLPVTASNEAFLVTWANAEGGNWHNTARYNPLNTSQRMAGSQVMGGGNASGVQAYTSWQEGLQATAQTLRNGYYPQIMAGLQSGQAAAWNQQGRFMGDLSKWGTNPGNVLTSTTSIGLGYQAGPTGGGGGGYGGGGAAPAAYMPSSGGLGGGVGSVEWSGFYGYASSLLGTPYRYGGTGQGGFDCSGFTQAVYARAGVSIGRDTSAQLRSGQVVGQDGNWAADISYLSPGDLIFYGQPGASGGNAHVVMYIGGGQVIQAGGQNVNVTALFQSASANEPFLGVRRYASFAGAPPGGANSAQPTGPAGNTSAPSAPPPLSDMPALIGYIQQNFPDLAWMLGVPAAASTLEEIVAGGITDPNQIQAKLEASPWWKTTSASVRQYEQTMATDPSALSFGAAGSQAQQTLGQVMTEAGKLGVQITMQQAQTLALDYIKYGWQSPELDQAIGSYVVYQDVAHTNATDMGQQLRSHAGQYLLNLAPGVIQSWAQNIVGGTQNMNQFDAYLARTASTKWTGMASQIAQGMTPYQITGSLRTDAAKTMEVDPNSIDFVNNPMYSRILDFVPPTSPGQKEAPQHRMMTDSEMQAYLKGSDHWQYTQQARDEASALGHTLAQTWGRMG
jgi:hypothetical protein